MDGAVATYKFASSRAEKGKGGRSYDGNRKGNQLLYN